MEGRCIVHLFTHGSQLLMIIFTENLNHHYMQSSSVVDPGGLSGGAAPPPTIRPCSNLFETDILTLTVSYITFKLADLLNEIRISVCH